MANLITLAIHTRQYALQLKKLLENEGIAATLQNVNPDNTTLSPGVRIRINESDLPLALRIVENTDIFTLPADDENGQNHTILVPVDCSEVSLKAAEIAIVIAHAHNCSVTLLHTYLNPYTATNIQLADALTLELNTGDEIRQQVELVATRKLAHLTDKLKELLLTGRLPSVKIKTKLVEGVPEDAIRSFDKTNNPYLIIMGTRSATRKEAEMIGSVTAEVLDKNRHTVLTVPEGANVKQLHPSQLRNILFLSNLETEDILAIDTFRRIFQEKDMNLTIAHIAGKRKPFGHSATESLMALADYCNKNMSNINCQIQNFDSDNAFDDMLNYISESKINLVIVPNKKKNALARFVNPTIANRILMRTDIPLLVVRV